VKGRSHEKDPLKTGAALSARETETRVEALAIFLKPEPRHSAKIGPAGGTHVGIVKIHGRRDPEG
jgi:hypothetical protein